MMTDAEIVALWQDCTLELVIADLRRKNLRDYRDADTRYQGVRSKAITAERNRRKGKSK